MHICILRLVHILITLQTAYPMGPDKTASISKLIWVHIESLWVVAWSLILTWNKQLMIRLEIVDTSQGDRTIIVPSPWGYRGVTVGCPYDFVGPARASYGDLAGSLWLSQESTIIFGPKWQSKIVRCPHDHRAVPPTGIVRRHCDVSMGYRLTIFSNLSLCGVKQNRRGHDARKSVWWSQGLPVEATRKRWFGHRTGIVYSS